MLNFHNYNLQNYNLRTKKLKSLIAFNATKITIAYCIIFNIQFLII